MRITEVKVFPVHEDKLKAFVSIVFDACFMVNDIKVIRGKDGLFISMPSRRKKSGEFKDVAHPLNNDTRQALESAILDEYERVLAEQGEAPEASRRYPRLDEVELGDPSANGSGTPVPGHSRESKPEPSKVAAPAQPEATSAEGPEDRTLEEVEEIHLRDSFWSVS